MKNQPIQYLALDVHQATTVATVRDAGGAIRMRATVPTEAKAIVALVKGITPPVHVVFEEDTQAQWLHDLLQPAGRPRGGLQHPRKHAPNEYLVLQSKNGSKIAGLAEQEKFFVDLLYALAR